MKMRAKYVTWALSLTIPMFGAVSASQAHVTKPAKVEPAKKAPPKAVEKNETAGKPDVQKKVEEKGSPCYPPSSPKTEHIMTPTHSPVTKRLEEALAATYKFNTQLNEQRYSTRATDETVPEARAGFRPTLDAQVSFGYDKRLNRGQADRIRNGVRRSVSSNNLRGSLVLRQSIYSGGSTVAATKAAEANAIASKYTYFRVEQEVMLQAITVFLDLLTKEEEVVLLRSNRDLLRKTLENTQDKYNVGEETQTSLAQAKAQLAEADARLQTAIAEREALKARYQQITSTIPGRLMKPVDFSKMLPKTLKDAIEIAKQKNPAIIEAEFQMRSARYSVEEQTGRLRPQVDFEASATRTKDRKGGLRISDNAAAVNVRWSLYEAGAIRARRRQAYDTAESRRLGLDRVRTQVVEQIIAAWENYLATKANVGSFKTRVEANKVRYEGTKQEVEVGTQILLEQLRANTDLINSRVDLINAEKAYLIAVYTVLLRLGQLSAMELKLKTKYYNPECHFEQVRYAWF